MYAINSNPGTMWDYSRKKKNEISNLFKFKTFPYS